MSVDLFAAVADDATLHTEPLKMVISQQAREMNVRVGQDIVHIIAIYSISYHWHGKFRWLAQNQDSKPYSLLPIYSDSIIPIKSIDFHEIYLIDPTASNCYTYDPAKDKFYEFQSPKPTLSRECGATLMKDGRIISIGGSNKHIDIYDTRSGVWLNHSHMSLQPLIDPGDKCCVVQDELHGNVVHVVGGSNAHGRMYSLDARVGFKCVERSKMWMSRGNINAAGTPRPVGELHGHAAIMSDGNHMLLFGGRTLNGVYKVNLSQANKQQKGHAGHTGKKLQWVGEFDRALFGYDITPDRKYLVVAGGVQYATLQRRSTINVLDLCQIGHEQNAHVHLLPNIRFALPRMMTRIGIATLDDTLHVFGGFDGRNTSNAHWVAKTRDIVIGTEL